MNKVLRRIEAAQRVADVRPIDVGHEMAAQQRRREGRQCARGHRGAEVGTADADIDDVRHWLAEGAPHPSLAHVGGKVEHLFSRTDDVRHDVVSIDQDRRAGEIAQCGVQDGAVLGDVDFLSGEHRVTPGLDPARLGELDERPQNGGVNALLGKIKQEIAEGDAELLKSRRIVGEVRSRRSREHARRACRSILPMPLESPASP